MCSVTTLQGAAAKIKLLRTGREALRLNWPKTCSASEQAQSIRGGQRSARKEGSARALRGNSGNGSAGWGRARGGRGRGAWGRGGAAAGGCVSERRERASIEPRSVRRGGRRERACHALPLRWPALGRSSPPAAAGGGWWPQPVSTPHHTLPTLLVRPCTRSADSHVVTSRTADFVDTWLFTIFPRCCVRYMLFVAVWWVRQCSVCDLLTSDTL